MLRRSARCHNRRVCRCANLNADARFRAGAAPCVSQNAKWPPASRCVEILSGPFPGSISRAPSPARRSAKNACAQPRGTSPLPR